KMFTLETPFGTGYHAREFKYWIRVKPSGTGACDNRLLIMYKIGSGGSWLSGKTINCERSDAFPHWRSATVTGLDLSEDQVKDLYLRLYVDSGYGGSDYDLSVDTVYVEIKTQRKYHKVDTIIEWDADPATVLLTVDNLQYHLTNNPSTTLKMKNWDTSQYETVGTGTTISGTQNLQKGSSRKPEYVSSSGEVSVWIYTGASTSSFILYIDQLYLEYTSGLSNYLMETIGEWSMPGSVSLEYLYYDHYLDFDPAPLQSFDFSIWKWTGTGTGWNTISSSISTTGRYKLTSDFYEAGSNRVKVRYLYTQGINDPGLNIDILKVEHTAKPCILNSTSDITVGSYTNYLDLLYSFRSTQSIDVSLWNYNTNEWDVIRSGLSSTFTELYYSIDSSKYVQNNKIQVNFYGENPYSVFDCDIDMLKVAIPTCYYMSPVFNDDQDPFTFIGWIKADTLSGTQSLYGEFNSNGEARNYISILDNGALSFDQHLPYGRNAVSMPGLIEVGTWLHIAVVKEDDSIIFYKNGTRFGVPLPHNEEYSGSTPTIAGVGSRYFNSHWNNDALNGTIDDFRLFEIAVPAKMIKLLYNSSSGTKESVKELNYGGIITPNNSTFPASTSFLMNVSSSYSNSYRIPYYNTRPNLKLIGRNFGNEYDYSFSPNTDLQSIDNRSIQVTHSSSGQQVVKVENMTAGFCEITNIYIDPQYNGSFSTTINLNDIFYYVSNNNGNQTLNIQFDDLSIEHIIYYVKVEYLYSQGLQSNSTFKLNLDVSNISSDIYDIQIAAYNIHNEITTIAYNNVMIDHSGPVVTPLFNDGDFFNNTAGSLSFNIFDPSGVDSASISYSRDYDYPFDYSMEQNAYYGSFDFNNITTESETFYGSFDFRDDADGFNPSGLTVNEDGGTLQVISSLFNHKKVVELHDTNTDDVWMRLSANSQPYGSIEFWISTDDATDRSRLYGNSAGVTSFQIRIDADKFQYWDGAWKDVGLSASDDVWYHVRIDFECTTGGYQGLAQYDWHLYINGNSYGDFNFGYTTDTNYYMYIDAIGVSWDSTSHNGLGYEVGYNANSNDIIPLLNEGYDINHQYGCTISIESAFNHYNVLKLYDDSSTYRTYLIIPFEQSSSQTLEFWFASSTAVDTNYFVLREGSTQIIPFRAVNDDFQYSDGSWKDIKTNFIVANTWYHVKVVLDDTNNDCDVYINGVLEGSNLSYQTSSTTSPDHFWVYTSAGDSGYATYLDAFGVSSDSSSHSGYGYDIGYNINPNDIRPLLEDGFYPFEINYGDSISIESYVDSLENVLHLNDQSSSSVGISKDLSNRTTGILEWWWRTSDSSKRSAVKLYEDDSQRIYLGYLSETFCGYWNDQYQYSTINILSDTWYHHKLKFNCSSDSYDWYINGELALSGLFDNVGDGINRFELKTYNSHTGYDVYFDEIKFTLGFIGDVDVSGNIWTFNFNDALLNGTYGLILFANDSLGYTSTFTNFDIYFDN
ncbi:MAG: LamG-like jellyroll fold domain-containing protein, partial [Promethearchaeota archaeon]